MDHYINGNKIYFLKGKLITHTSYNTIGIGIFNEK